MCFFQTTLRFTFVESYSSFIFDFLCYLTDENSQKGHKVESHVFSSKSRMYLCFSVCVNTQIWTIRLALETKFDM